MTLQFPDFAPGLAGAVPATGTAAPDQAGPARPGRAAPQAETPILGAHVTRAVQAQDGPAAAAPAVAAPRAEAAGAAPAAGGPARDPAAPQAAPAPDAAPGDTGTPEADFTPADPLYASQWHFPLLGDIETIWNEYSGAGVHVYVADEGIEYTHEDLAANYDASMHFVWNGVAHDPFPLNAQSGHGTSCGGLIAAVQGNGIGGTGVAWGATLTGLDFLDQTQFAPEDEMLASLRWAENFDIMSNSWGITPSYGSYQSPIDTPDNVQFGTMQVFAEISGTGRDGLGTIIVQASGNDTRNAQGDALNVSRHTISVAATDADGFATYYTNYGSNILVAAPAGAVTTDLTDGGYDSGPYTDGFGGTSAATPITAGVVALMLEANSGLGWRDVHNILAASASLTGTAYGDTPSGTASQYEQGNWFANGGTNWNGGGWTFNLTYGFGMVDVFAAVRMAEVWTAMHGAVQDSTNEAHVAASLGAPVALADAATTIASIVVTGNIAIENIQVTLDMTHSDGREIEIWLVSPDGTQFMLFENEGNRRLMSSGFEWIFGVEAARGLDSAGTWEILVIDETGGNTGTLNAVTLDFYGSAATSDEVHHITEDFLAVAGVEGSRTVFHDNGGHDVLNMVAVAGDVVIDMAKGGAAAVDGTTWFTFEVYGGLYEDLYLGDGNDIAHGNNTGNLIQGMRGDDELYGRNGNDTLDGGAGNDSLSSGGQNDVLIGGEGDDELRGGGQRDLLQGGEGDDDLRGQRGDDTLEGGAGNDTLNGGEHSDILTGGDDADTFVFWENFGQDIITDFVQGLDLIDVSALSAIVDWADLTAQHLSDGATGAVITALGYSITIEGIFAASLVETDFVF